MPSYSFRIKSRENKAVSIYVSFRPANQSVVAARTGFYVHPDNWSKSKQRAKPNSPELKNLNSSLNNLEVFLSDRLNIDHNKGIDITNKWLKNTINKFNNRVSSNDISYILNLFDDMIDSLKFKRAKDGSVGLKNNTVKGYNNFRNNLVSYQEYVGEQIKVSELGLEEIDGFVKWLLQDMKYSKNEVSRKYKRLKGLLRYALVKDVPLAINLDALGNEYSYKTKKYINVINQDEFLKLVKLKDLPPSLENVRRWLLIGLLIGQRISDLKKIKQEEIRYDKNGIALIDIIQVKGQEPVTVPINNQVVINILKYRFPRPISDQKFNDYMKEVCKRAGINEIVKGYKMNPETKRKEVVEAPKYELVASHDMRRSFATYHYENGVSVNLIMKITGHKRESTFYEYIDRKPKKDFDAYNFLNATQ